MPQGHFQDSNQITLPLLQNLSQDFPSHFPLHTQSSHLAVSWAIRPLDLIFCLARSPGPQPPWSQSHLMGRGRGVLALSQGSAYHAGGQSSFSQSLLELTHSCRAWIPIQFKYRSLLKPFRYTLISSYRSSCKAVHSSQLSRKKNSRKKKCSRI